MAFEAKIKDYIKGKGDDSNVTLFLQRFSERYLYGNFQNGQPSGGRIEYVRLFTIIAVFILIIACINFMNLSTARASRKAKEVGIKKSIGAQRGSLIFQYISESMVTILEEGKTTPRPPIAGSPTGQPGPSHSTRPSCASRRSGSSPRR